MQLINVYIGVVLKEKEEGKLTATVPSRFRYDTLTYRSPLVGNESARDKKISNIVLIVTTTIAVAAYIYIQRQMRAVKGDIIYARRKARYDLVFKPPFNDQLTRVSQTRKARACTIQPCICR